jgi:hypothetical protein
MPFVPNVSLRVSNFMAQLISRNKKYFFLEEKHSIVFFMVGGFHTSIIHKKSSMFLNFDMEEYDRVKSNFLVTIVKVKDIH